MIRFSDPNCYVREADISDAPFYCQMLRNADWLTNSGFGADEFCKEEQIENFIAKEHPDDIHWLIFHERSGFLGFVHFKVISDDYVVIIGGIAPKYLNSGLGIKLFVESIHLYFTLGGRRKLRQNVYQENLRSCKMNLAVGAELVGLKKIDNHKYDVFETQRESFYDSPVVRRILRIHFQDR